MAVAGASDRERRGGESRLLSAVRMCGFVRGFVRAAKRVRVVLGEDIRSIPLRFEQRRGISVCVACVCRVCVIALIPDYCSGKAIYKNNVR